MSLAAVMSTGPITGFPDVQLLRGRMADWLLCWVGIADVIGSCIAAEIGPKSLQEKDGVARHGFFEGD